MLNVQNKPIMIARTKVSEFFPGLSPKSLANLNSLGMGPTFFRVGRKVFYDMQTLVNWMSRNPVKTVDDMEAGHDH